MTNKRAFLSIIFAIQLLAWLPICCWSTSFYSSSEDQGDPSWDDHDLDRSTFLENFCHTTRHVHLSTGKDASRSITISFSSHPCDMLNSIDTHSYPPTPKHSKGSKSKGTHLKSSIGAVMIGTDPHFESFHFFRDEGGIRYNATLYNKNRDDEIYTSEFQHHITIPSNHDDDESVLKPNTTYYYKCLVLKHANWKYTQDPMGDDEVEVKEEERRRKRTLLEGTHPSEIFSFRTAPDTKGHNRRTKVAILGDVGQLKHSKETLAVMASRMDDIDSVVMVGDLSYANGQHRKWDTWFDMLDSTKILRKKPLYIASGNHDAEGDLKTGTVYQAFEHRFRMPQIQDAIVGKVTKKRDVDLNNMYQLPYDFGNSFYSYSNGMVHSIVLNSFADFEPGSNQYNWLVDELQKVDRKIYPWLIVLVHCPIYNTFSLHQNDIQPTNMKKFLEPLFIDHNVNFVISGHLHAYSRSHPVTNDKLNPKGPIHIVLGNGGRQANAPFNNDIPEEWVAKRDHTTYGYGTIDFISPRRALYEWVQTGHNGVDDKGNNFLDVPENLTDVVYVDNQYYL